MKTSKTISDAIKRKKALMQKEKEMLDLSVGHSGLNITLYGRNFGKGNTMSDWQRNAVRRTKSTREMANNLDAYIK